MYRYILRESCSQFDSLPLTSLTISPRSGGGGVESANDAERTFAPTVQIVDALVGPPSEADVQRAATFGAVLLCFNVQPSANVRAEATKEAVEIRQCVRIRVRIRGHLRRSLRLGHSAAPSCSLDCLRSLSVPLLSLARSLALARTPPRPAPRALSYDIIYRLVEGLGVTVANALPPVVKDTVIGSAEVLQTFSIGGKNPVAGCRVKEGTIKRNSQLKLLRKGTVVAVSESGADSMKHFKDDVTTAKAGTEFAISFAVSL